MKNKEILNWEKRICKHLEIIFSKEGKEFQLDLVAQGYEEVLFEILYFSCVLPGFSIFKIIRDLREEIKNE